MAAADHSHVLLLVERNPSGCSSMKFKHMPLALHEILALADRVHVKACYGCSSSCSLALYLITSLVCLMQGMAAQTCKFPGAYVHKESAQH